MTNDDSLKLTGGETGSSSLSATTASALEWGSARLPHGVDFAALRRTIGIRDVLTLLDWQPFTDNGRQLRGSCPIHKSENPNSRSFSVNLEKNAFRCFGCGMKGNQLDLFVAVTGLPLFQAAVELCHRLRIELSQIERR